MQPIKDSACTNEGPVFFFWVRDWEEFFFFFSFRGVAMPLAQAKNGDKRFWKIKVSYSQ
jgi:hypothetical protein